MRACVRSCVRSDQLNKHLPPSKTGALSSSSSLCSPSGEAAKFPLTAAGAPPVQKVGLRVSMACLNTQKGVRSEGRTRRDEGREEDRSKGLRVDEGRTVIHWPAPERRGDEGTASEGDAQPVRRKGRSDMGLEG